MASQKTNKLEYIVEEAKQEEVLVNGRAIIISKDFDTTFPALADEMTHYYDRVDMEDLIRGDKHDQLWEEELPLLLSRVDGEITRVIGQPWTQLKAQNDGFVAMHTLAVVAMAWNDPMFVGLAPELQNILKWASLLHDIAKFSMPTIQGKDHVHPFKSAAIVLELFDRFGFIEELTVEKRQNLLQVQRLIQESVQPLPSHYREGFRHGVPYCTMMHSHHNLPEIFYYLWYGRIAPRGSFTDQVFRLVLFHQSVEGLKKYPPMAALTPIERYRFCDEGFFSLLTILMIADSKSYNCLYPSVCSDARKEFLNQNQKFVSSWQKIDEQQRYQR